MNYFEVLTDDRHYADRWFLEDPQVADINCPDSDALTGKGVEPWQSVRNGKKVDVWLVPRDNLRYPLTVNPGGVCEIDAREFTEGRPYAGPPPYLVPIKDGRHVAFNLAAFDMPVVSTEIADILRRIAPNDVQRFPVILGKGIEGYEIINTVRELRCVDEVLSNARKWGLEDDRPEKIGHYVEFDPLVIDPSRTEGAHIFRLWGSWVELIVSEKVRQALEPIADLGVAFQPVT